MANFISGRIESIGQTQTIAPKQAGGNPFIKRKFVIRALSFDPNDGTPELSEINTPILEINGQDKVGMLDQFKVGDVVKVGFYVDGRKVVNQDQSVKYFNSVCATRIERINVQLPQMTQQQPAAQPQMTQQQPAPQTAQPAPQPAAQPQGNQQAPQTQVQRPQGYDGF